LDNDDDMLDFGRLDVIATHREREREQTKMMIGGDDDGNDISCMCVCACVGLCVIQSLWLLSILIIIIMVIIIISSRGGSVIHSIHSFIQCDVGITHIHQQSMIHDP